MQYIRENQSRQVPTARGHRHRTRQAADDTTERKQVAETPPGAGAAAGAAAASALPVAPSSCAYEKVVTGP